MKDRTVTPYEEVRPVLSTGDIILFRGRGPVSSVIKFMTGSTFSHVGMAMILAEYDAVFLWESTTLSDLTDVLTGEARRGVQLVPFSNRLQTYDGQVAIRHLEIHSPTDTTRWPQILMELRLELRGRPYEGRMVELARSARDWGPRERNYPDLSSLFCSELIAETYQRLGLLTSDPPANEYTPADLAADIELVGATLSPVVEIG